MSVSEIETAVMALPLEERMRIADRVWDGLETDAGDDSELAAEVRRRIGSEEVDGPAAIEAARKRARP